MGGFQTFCSGFAQNLELTVSRRKQQQKGTKITIGSDRNLWFNPIFKDLGLNDGSGKTNLRGKNQRWSFFSDQNLSDPGDHRRVDKTRSLQFGKQSRLSLLKCLRIKTLLRSNADVPQHFSLWVFGCSKPAFTPGSTAKDIFSIEVSVLPNKRQWSNG